MPPPGWKIALALSLCAGLDAEVRRVGPNERYRTPCAAITAAAPGDVIEIGAAGNYAGDVCAFAQDRLTLRGVNGRPRIDAAGRVAQGKAIWVISGDEVAVENIEFTGAKCADRNAAGIRAEGGRLTVSNCLFRRNENGILSSNNPAAEITVEYSEFDGNGAGDGYSHNIYIGTIAEFTLRYSWSHDARTGHLVKSRAQTNNILYNFLSTGAGNDSYELDLPNGGTALVLGNVIVQGATSDNPGVVTFGVESKGPPGPETVLRVVHNTFVNMRSGGTFIMVGSGGTASPIIRNNVFGGPGTITNARAPLLAGNATLAAYDFPGLAKMDFRLTAGKALGAAVPQFESLLPQFEYRHPACAGERSAAKDAGAFERLPPRPGGDTAMPARCR